MKTAGYSGTPLAKKLGYKPGVRACVVNAPDNYQAMLAPVPEGVTFAKSAGRALDLGHVFLKDARKLDATLKSFGAAIAPDGAFWVSWPKKSSGVSTDLSEDVIRKAALALGLVDVKVCAVDDVWSGLKLVWRKENRAARMVVARDKRS